MEAAIGGIVSNVEIIPHIFRVSSTGLSTARLVEGKLPSCAGRRSFIVPLFGATLPRDVRWLATLCGAKVSSSDASEEDSELLRILKPEVRILEGFPRPVEVDGLLSSSLTTMMSSSTSTFGFLSSFSILTFFFLGLLCDSVPKKKFHDSAFALRSSSSGSSLSVDSASPLDCVGITLVDAFTGLLATACFLVCFRLQTFLRFGLFLLFAPSVLVRPIAFASLFRTGSFAVRLLFLVRRDPVAVDDALAFTRADSRPLRSATCGRTLIKIPYEALISTFEL
ncbi:hypothetical protein RvY_09958 [Ramazzottius varieornatus]|uniref:Uncharacterized protein n=1 Tax=Ramazzottius varieornatus TaxID=947166 RepID=A0A1D1VDJ7_RAMVA|nr:hypothetical protein RvY_09958 [Ramazzottius varieornatus]